MPYRWQRRGERGLEEKLRRSSRSARRLSQVPQVEALLPGSTLDDSLMLTLLLARVTWSECPEDLQESSNQLPGRAARAQWQWQGCQSRWPWKLRIGRRSSCWESSAYLREAAVSAVGCRCRGAKSKPAKAHTQNVPCRIGKINTMSNLHLKIEQSISSPMKDSCCPKNHKDVLPHPWGFLRRWKTK